MAIEDTNKAIKESNKTFDGIITISESIEKKSNKLKDNAVDKAIVVNETKKPYVASSLVDSSVDNELARIIKDTNSDYSDFVENISRYLANNFTIKLTKKDLAAISNKGSMLIENLIANTDVLKRDIQSILTQNLANGVSKRDLVLDLQELYPAYSRNAYTIVNSGLSRIFVDTNVSKFKESGFKWYIWAGPNDKITRELPCKHWVWHRFPSSQLANITTVRMRLWNCRHSIIPISDEDIKQYPVGSLAYS